MCWESLEGFGEPGGQRGPARWDGCEGLSGNRRRYEAAGHHDPGAVTAEATGPSGAAVSYSATAQDAVDGTVPVTCSPASGSTFPLDRTTVDCSAIDSHGNSVQHVLQRQRAGHDAAGCDHARERDGGGDRSLGCGRQLQPDGQGPGRRHWAGHLHAGVGSKFTLGTTPVICSATDKAGNTSPGYLFNVTVMDTTPPTLKLPADLTADATGPSGARVTFSPTASDLVTGAVPVSCAPASGSTFAPGYTTVHCTAPTRRATPAPDLSRSGARERPGRPRRSRSVGYRLERRG